MAFLQAFTDDSAAQSGDRRLFLAGYLHSAESWASFSEEWYAELRAWPAIDYFKSTEANNLHGQFHYKKGWDEAKRNAKIGMLAAIVRRYQPFSFEFSVNRQIFEDELKPVSPYGLGHPHFAMCFAVVSGIARYVSGAGLSTPIEFIFDEQQGVDADIALFFSQMKKSLPMEAQNLIDGNPIFKNDKEKRYMALQAADLLVWSIRRQHETGLSPPLLEHLVNRNLHLKSEVPDAMLRSWADHHSQQPGVSLVRSKSQGRAAKEMIKRLQEAGIDPSKITGPGIYYPEGTSAFVLALEKLKRLVRRF